MQRSDRFIPFLLILMFYVIGCASPYLKGISPEGQTVYIDTPLMQNTEAFQNYISSQQTETDKQNYLFERIKSAKNLIYIRDGHQYTWLQAYRGGKWLIRNRYEKGIDARSFAKKYIWKSEAGNPYLVQFPDGSTHIGYYILLNELELLEATVAKA